MASLILPCILVFCIFLVKGSTVSNLSIKTFYNGSGYVWTTNGTASDKYVTCKADRVTLGYDTRVYFNRQFFNGRMWIDLRLVGNFENSTRAIHPQNMYVNPRNESRVDLEQMIFMNAANSCAIIETAHLRETSQRTVCELRVKGFRTVNIPPECNNEFTARCQSPHYDVFKYDCRLPK